MSVKKPVKKPVKKQTLRKAPRKVPAKGTIAAPVAPKKSAEEALAEAEEAQRVADKKNTEFFVQSYNELCEKTGIQLVAQITFIGKDSHLALIPAKMAKK